jgi:hypothetical protein
MPEVKVLLDRIRDFLGDDPSELSNQELLSASSLAQYAQDMCLVELEKRGLVQSYEGMPIVPYQDIPGLPYIETCLTRGQETITPS